MSQIVQQPKDSQDLSTAYLLSAVPNYVISLIFLITWLAPETFGESMVSNLMLIMLMEFINDQILFVGTRSTYLTRSVSTRTLSPVSMN